MNKSDRLRIAIQKSGRLSEKSFDLLRGCGLEFDWRRNQLLCACTNFPLDLMLVRDDDIAEFVADGICELGVVGFNMLEETLLERGDKERAGVQILEKLGFGGCRLSIAIPEDQAFDGPKSLAGKSIATSYPATLQDYLNENDVQAEVIHISGSVEIAPALQIANAICDLVSTGSTLRSNGLKEVETILKPIESQRGVPPVFIDMFGGTSTRSGKGVFKSHRTLFWCVTSVSVADEGSLRPLTCWRAPAILTNRANSIQTK